MTALIYTKVSFSGQKRDKKVLRIIWMAPECIRLTIKLRLVFACPVQYFYFLIFQIEKIWLDNGNKKYVCGDKV